MAEKTKKESDAWKQKTVQDGRATKISELKKKIAEFRE